MKKSFWIVFIMIVITFFSYSKGEKQEKLSGNPFLVDWDTPFGVPPFEKIKEEHYLPAFQEGMMKQKEEIEAIIQNPETPTFENTIEALERSGELLMKVSNVFDVLNASMTNDKMQEIAKEIAPLRSKHQDDIFLNEKLFQRLKKVYEQKESLKLSPEQLALLEKYYKDFVRAGVNLDEDKKERLREINAELSLLTVKFGDNVLREDNRFELIIEKETDLEGLPQEVIKAAAQTAKERGKEGKWVFTLHKPSLIPFLQYSTRRELREKIFKAYINRCNHDDELDNKAILTRIASLRAERANLLGYKTHAHYILEENMAKVPENVYSLLQKIWEPALKVAKKEAEELQKMIFEEGNEFKLEPWDWWFYAEKVKRAKYDLDEEMLRPYFKLENVLDGAFKVANKLYGLQFIERFDVPKYHDEVRVFEVKDADGSHLGIFYTDYFPRESKRGGAWMNNLREQYRIKDKDIRPIITNNGNFSRPVGGKPALLSPEEVTTLFHEFGHALHGLLSRCTYVRLSGTSVPRDFVELPSQIMENWVFEEDVLRMYARHYESGELIPQELVDKLKNSQLFNQGFASVEYLAAAFLDMDWHTLEEPKELDAIAFEEKSLQKIGLIPQIVVRYRSPYFSHIFSGGYSAGYYSYIWSEVLDADAFEAFKEKGLFNQEVALSFRKHILEKGGTDEPMRLYINFRGSEPKVEPLLRRKGLLESSR